MKAHNLYIGDVEDEFDDPIFVASGCSSIDKGKENLKRFENIFGYPAPLAPRFRHAMISREGPYYYTYGRCGGGNTEEYEDYIEIMKTLPGFIEECEDNDDETYRDFYYLLDEDKWSTFINTENI